MSTTVVDDSISLDLLLDVMPDPPPAVPSMNDPVFKNMDFVAVANEFARRIYKAGTIATRHGMTPEQAVMLCGHEPFRKMVRTARALWEGSDNAGERAKQYHREGQALVAAEIISMISDVALPAALRLDAAKFSAKVAGIDVPPKENNPLAAAGGTSFAVNIHLGSGRVETITTSMPPAATIDHAPFDAEWSDAAL